MATRHETAKQMDTRVRGLVHHGAIGQATRELESNWSRSLLPHLPLRHPFVLERINSQGVARMLEVLKNAPAVELRLLPGVDPRHPSMIGVGLAGEDNVIGFLSDDAADILDEAGEYSSLYEPKLLALRTDRGQKSVECELARPDLRQCSACSELHTGEHENCDECRGKRRRKKKTLAETAEQAPVPVSSAFETLSVAQANASKA